MAITINNLVLPDYRILVLPDAGVQPSTGIIALRSNGGGGRFRVFPDVGLGVEVEYDHVLFVREMTAEVEVNGIEYLAMHTNAVVGLIP